MPPSLLDTAASCLDKALSHGADAGDVMVFDSMDMNAGFRMGKPETIEQAESIGLGLRVLVADKKGYRQAIVSTNDLEISAMDELVQQAVAMAKAAPSDPHITLADEALLANDLPELDIEDQAEPRMDSLKAWAEATEQAALDVKGVTNSDGASASYNRSTLALVTSNGFAQSYVSTYSSLSASVIAGTGQAMETNYDYSIARFAGDLRSAADVGKKAGELAVKRLNPRKIDSCQIPVVFDPRVGRGLLRSFAKAINGAAIAKGMSFLQDDMGNAVFAPDITIIDDPFLPRGMKSEPFDAEGIKGEKRAVIDNGILTSWLLDLRSAHKLGLTTTGHASRGLSSAPSPASSNLYMQPGKLSVNKLIADIKQGVYITDTMGMGVNDVTGDYSQGASGFMIENGEITYPVSEITIAGNLKDMFKTLTPANDLEFRYGTNTPTLRIEQMTIAGT